MGEFVIEVCVYVTDFSSIDIAINMYFLYTKQGDKQNGFDVLYQNLKCGSTSAKELAEFLRARYVVSKMDCLHYTSLLANTRY